MPPRRSRNASWKTGDGNFPVNAPETTGRALYPGPKPKSTARLGVVQFFGEVVIRVLPPPGRTGKIMRISLLQPRGNNRETQHRRQPALAFGGIITHVFSLNSLPKSALPALAWAAFSWGQSPGIQVRFLSNPAPDSVAKYTVYRSNAAGTQGTSLGEVSPAASDTLSFNDTTAKKGIAYWYSLTGTTRGGLESEYSSQTAVAFPVLSLPDSLPLKTGTGYGYVNLTDSTHPLRWIAPLDVEVFEPGNRVKAAFEENEAGIFLYSPDGSFSGTVRLRISYFGQFAAEDTFRVNLPQAPMGLLPRPGKPSGRGLQLLGIPNAAGSGEMTLQIFNPPAEGTLLLTSVTGQGRVLRISGNANPWVWRGTVRNLGLSHAVPVFGVVRDGQGKILSRAERLRLR
jgi:hypothetical protein